MKKHYSILLLVMAVVMMAMSPTMMWANDTQSSASPQVTITATSNDIRLGTVTGGGTYDYSATEMVTLEAIPSECCDLVMWSDGVTACTRQVPLTGDLTLTAEFEQVEPYYNEIWYTTTDGNAITTSVLTQMGLTSNTYDSANSRYVMTFSQDLTSIEFGAFKDCSTLQTFTIPSTVKVVGESAFQACTALQSITIPSGVQTIGGEAFANCSDVKSITIPESVGTIGLQAFKNCAVIPSGLSNNSSMANDMLKERGLLICDAEQEDGLLTKGTSAVFCRKGATTVTITDNVTSVGNNAFMNCSKLVSIYIPSNVTSIGEKVFSGCSSLSNIIVDEGNTVYDSRNNCNAIIRKVDNTLIVGCKNTVIPSSVKGIGDYAFCKCTGLTNIVFNSILQFGSNVFLECTNLNTITLSLSDGSYVAADKGNFPTLTMVPTYTRKMANEWGTIVVPFNMEYDASNGNYKLYKLTASSSSALTFTEYGNGEVINTGTPMAIKAVGEKADGKYTVTLIANDFDVNTTINNPEAVGGLTLTGTYSLRDIRTGYIVNNNAFYNVSSLLSNNNLWKDAAGNAISEENRHVYVSPFRAYLDSSGARQASKLRIDTEGTTAVEAVEALGAMTEGTAEYYDLNGHRIPELQPGVNIVRYSNGKTIKVYINEGI